MARFLTACAIVAVTVGCDTNSPDKLLASAQSYIAQGDHRAAMIQLRNALQQRPEDGNLRLLLGRTLLQMHEASAAEKELRKALQYGQPQDAALPLLASAMLERGDAASLISEFGAVNLTAPQPQAQFKSLLGQAYLRVDRLADAAASFEAAEKAAPGYLPARLGRARVLAADGRLREATLIASQAMADHPNSAEVHLLASDLRSIIGDRAGSMAALKEAIRIDADHLQARYALTDALIRDAQFDAAATQIEALRKLARGSLHISYLEAAVALGRNDLSKARAELQWILKHAPDHAPTLMLLAAVELQAGQPYAAEAMLRHAASVTPRESVSLTAAHLALAERALRNNDLPTAVLLYKALVDRDPNNLVALNNLAWAAGQLQDPRAIGYAQRAVKLHPDNAAALDTLGELLVKSGDLKPGIAALRKATELAPNRPDIRLNYAKALLADGQNKVARVELKALQSQEFPGRAEAAAMLKGLE